MKLKRFLTFLCALFFSTSLLWAQSSGDKLYNQGLKLQKTMTVQAQNSAISKFSSAKKLYDSATKKAQCDNAISVSRNIIASLKNGGGKKTGSTKISEKTNKESSEEPITIALTNTEFNLDNDIRTLSIGVTCNKDDWSVSPVALPDGSSFLSAQKSGIDKIMIDVPANNTTETREQKVQVKSGMTTAEISITQSGKHVEFEVSTKEFSFKEKGGKKKFTISCNATQEYVDNGYENWFVESKPSWVKIEVNEKREKSALNKIGDTFNSLVKGTSKSDKSDMIKSSVTLICDPLIKGSNGRKGEVKLRSGDQTVTLYVSEF